MVTRALVKLVVGVVVSVVFAAAGSGCVSYRYVDAGPCTFPNDDGPYRIVAKKTTFLIFSNWDTWLVDADPDEHKWPRAAFNYRLLQLDGPEVRRAYWEVNERVQTSAGILLQVRPRIVAAVIDRSEANRIAPQWTTGNAIYLPYRFNEHLLTDALVVREEDWEGVVWRIIELDRPRTIASLMADPVW